MLFGATDRTPNPPPGFPAAVLTHLPPTPALATAGPRSSQGAIPWERMAPNLAKGALWTAKSAPS